MFTTSERGWGRASTRRGDGGPTGVAVRPSTRSPTLVVGWVSWYQPSWWVRGAHVPPVPHLCPSLEAGVPGRPTVGPVGVTGNPTCRRGERGARRVPPGMWLKAQFQQNGIHLLEKFPSSSSL